MTLTGALSQLHLLRVRGLVIADQVTDGEAMRALVAEGLATRNVHGYLLTGAGRERHATLLQEHRRLLDLAVVEGAYATFLAVNPSVEDTCVAWQLSARDAETARATGTALAAHLQTASRGLGEAGTAVAHLRAYPARLSAALTLSRHDSRFLTSPAVDSFHNVWFQLDEDLLATLGRERGQDGDDDEVGSERAVRRTADVVEAPRLWGLPSPAAQPGPDATSRRASS